MRVETITEQLLFATLRIETPSGTGTGFIMNYQWSEDLYGSFLITNKHVVDGTENGRLTFTVADQSSEGPELSLGQTTSITLSDDAWMWTGHPSADIDIAALPLVPVERQLNERGKTPFFRSIPTDSIPEQDALEKLDAVEEVLFVGYPSGIYDRANNLPIFRKGITATSPSIDYEGKPTFLIDASVFPGSSGSPVFIYNTGSWFERGTTVVGGSRLLLLGVVARVLSREEDGSLKFDNIPTEVELVVTTKERLDLGIVYKARTVVETIEYLLRQRQRLSAAK